MHRLSIAFVLLLALASCEGSAEPAIDDLENKPARFEFVSSWEPSIERRSYVTFVDYSFVVRNIGGRPAVPACDILLRNQPLEGWSEGTEISAGHDGRVRGRALFTHDVDTNHVLSRLRPRCRGATNRDPVPRVEKVFFGKEGDQSYYELGQRGFKVRFGPKVSRAERRNIRGTRSHPEVVIIALEHEPGSKIVTIVDVDCVGREVDLC